MNKEENNQKHVSRREFLRRLGMGAGAAMAMSVMEPLRVFGQEKQEGVGDNRMTYRVQHGSGEQISLLGFGMMRLPNDQDEVNQLVDYAIEHGVNYFDTAPMYMGGQSEVLTGNALSRHPRDKYYVATKMSNQRNHLWEDGGAVCGDGTFARWCLWQDGQELTAQLKAVRPNDSTARWAFRWVGSHSNILTTLSGMNEMDHLKENIETFSPLEICTEAENTLLAEIADQMAGFPTIPCTTCAYCMPCPYGVDIPGNFAYYNEAVNSHLLPLPEKQAADYAVKKQQFADGMRQALPNVESWARSCEDCEECLPKCPQQIRIPNQMARIVELLRKR